jgi:hypothetical protein
MTVSLPTFQSKYLFGLALEYKVKYNKDKLSQYHYQWNTRNNYKFVFVPKVTVLADGFASIALMMTSFLSISMTANGIRPTSFPVGPPGITGHSAGIFRFLVSNNLTVTNPWANPFDASGAAVADAGEDGWVLDSVFGVLSCGDFASVNDFEEVFWVSSFSTISIDDNYFCQI